MALALKIKHVDRMSRRRKRITFEPTFSGNYPAGGELVSYLAATNDNFLPDAYPGELPAEVHIENAATGYDFQVTIGASLGVATGDALIKIIDHATGVELAAGAYPAAITGVDDKMRVVAISRF